MAQPEKEVLIRLPTGKQRSVSWLVNWAYHGRNAQREMFHVRPSKRSIRRQLGRLRAAGFNCR